MMEQRTTQLQDQHSAVSPPQVELPQEDPRFTAYLDRLCAPLAGKAPEGWLPEFRAEMGSHLVCLAEAGEELEMSPAEAAAHACRALGEPEALAGEWLQRWSSATAAEPFRSTLLKSFACFAIGLVFAAWLLFRSFGDLLYMGNAVRVFAILLMPVVLGVFVGRRTSGRRGPAAMAAVALLAVVCAVGGAILPGDDPLEFRPFLPQMLLAYWLPLAAAASSLTGRRRERRKRRRERLQRG